MHDVQQRALTSARALVPKHERVRTIRNAVTSALLMTLLALPAVATGQSGPANQAGGAPQTAAPTSAALDIDRLVAGARDRGVLLQRSRPTGNSTNNDTMRWVGIGMLGLGGLLALNGALTTCGAAVDYTSGSVSTSACWGRTAVGGGVAAAGLFMMTR